MPKFYVTTAIDYSNSPPHLGTAFEKIGADVIARYRRLCGDEVYFVMGNDEHSQNVRKKAEELRLDPKTYCDRMAEEFRAVWKALHISNDFFIQTTSGPHHETVREIARRIHAARDGEGQPVVVKAPYEGHYCVSCEAFYREKDLAEGLCPNHKTKPEWIREENHFFRLSAFSGALKEHFRDHPDFLRPGPRRNEILGLLEQGLEDVSMSRANREWGVPLPFDRSAVAYVWFDALINYVTAVGPIGSETYRRFWPADLHVIGKDITRFHCLIWPAMLMAAGLPLPRSVWAHGFVSIGGEKMSKSRGIAADPRALAAQYGADVLRYHLLREVPWDRDGDFTEERLVARYNADLANDLGNLASRTLTMVRKFAGAEVKKPAIAKLGPQLEEVDAVASRYRELMDSYALDRALEEVWKLVSGSNLLIDRMQPWAMAKDRARAEELRELLYVLLERLRWTAVLLSPVMPERSAALAGLTGAAEEESGWRLHRLPAPGAQPAFRPAPPVPLFPRRDK